MPIGVDDLVKRNKKKWKYERRIIEKKSKNGSRKMKEEKKGNEKF